MRSSLTLVAAGGAAGMFWQMLPRWVQVVSAFGLLMLCVVELNKDTNESWFSSGLLAQADDILIREDFGAERGARCKAISAAKTSRVV